MHPQGAPHALLQHTLLFLQTHKPKASSSSSPPPSHHSPLILSQGDDPPPTALFHVILILLNTKNNNLSTPSLLLHILSLSPSKQLVFFIKLIWKSLPGASQLSLVDTFTRFHMHTQTRSLTTPWTRNSNSLLLVALRAPPAESSMSIYETPFSKSLSYFFIPASNTSLYATFPLLSKRECSLPPSRHSGVPFLHYLSFCRVARESNLSLSLFL